MKQKIKLKHKLTDTYWHREYYKSPKGILYAYTNEGTKDKPNWILYACSKDGEPSHAVNIDNYELDKPHV